MEKPAKNFIRSFIKGDSGQAMVELALSLPILILVMCLIIDSGWLYYHKIAIDNACREGARYASIHHAESGYEDDVEDLVYGILDFSSPVTVITTEPDSSSVSVLVRSDVPVLTGLSSTFIGSEVEIESSSVMRIEP
ncbi:MAG: TadE family protein [Lachnospiraceae bacterium]|nr:TadE family protein [Lachnospiraceae bacterium]